MTLGEGLRQLQLKLEDARRQLSGRKGGAEELKKIEADVRDQQEQLRQQAKNIQDEFRKSLEVLRQPKELRDTINAIEEIKKKVTEFLNSFENPGDALKALGDAQEFVKRSIQELSDEIQKNLDNLQGDLRKATEDFQRSQRDILNEGRANPVVSEIIAKRQRLADLEREFRQRQKELTDQINGERKKLDFVNQRRALEQEIAKLVNGSANALAGAAQSLANALAQARGLQFGTSGVSGGGGGQTLNITINAGAGSDGKQIGVAFTEHLKRTGLISPSRDFRLNPV
ncbi:MAG: hypothetical protein HY231_25730 [Acidobacteria bacterium]|nr:hypothetical protein [Acidobacteriota bacterium]